MRLMLANAIHHCRHRTAFQRKLVDQPLMGQVLADLALDVEAATALAFRLARCFDRASDPHAGAWRRLMTPVTKYWICKMAPAFGYEAMECLGGNGYVEEGLAARIYREMPLNAIWEGSGNVMALDLLRVLQREPETAAIVMEDLAAAAGGDAAGSGGFVQQRVQRQSGRAPGQHSVGQGVRGCGQCGLAIQTEILGGFGQCGQSMIAVAGRVSHGEGVEPVLGNFEHGTYSRKEIPYFAAR